MNMIGVRMKCETRIVRRTWDLTIADGLSVNQLTSYLGQIPGDARIVRLDDDVSVGQTIITFEQEKKELEP